MGARNARIVLIDADGVRSVMTASWLVQMGWPQVYVFSADLAGRPLVRGSETGEIPGLDRANPATVSTAALKTMLDRGEAAVVDLAPSITYETGHIPGAWVAVRARLRRNLPKIPDK